MNYTGEIPSMEYLEEHAQQAIPIDIGDRIKRIANELMIEGMIPAKLEITLGRIFWKRVRWNIKKLQASGYNIKWEESPGFLSRDFIISGDYNGMIKVKRYFERISEDAERRTNQKKII